MQQSQLFSQLEISWQQLLHTYIASQEMQILQANIYARYISEDIIYPPFAQIFNAFALSPVSKTKVIIIGQDPYHGENQAMGLSFSVANTHTIPPSLRNIHKEMYYDLGIDNSNIGDLTPWASQGVLLLNSTLTVAANKAGSHSKLGWEHFTNQVIYQISQTKSHLVFILWGGHAKKKHMYIQDNQHLILTSSHPSPLAAHTGFFHNKHFSKTNAFLQKTKQTPIDWQLSSSN